MHSLGVHDVDPGRPHVDPEPAASARASRRDLPGGGAPCVVARRTYFFVQDGDGVKAVSSASRVRSVLTGRMKLCPVVFFA